MAPRREPPPSTEVFGGRGDVALVRQFRLAVVTGPDAGVVYSSAGERAVVGTHPSAQVVLSDTAVSRFHCELTIAGGRVRVRDLESTNGTRVNGVAVETAWLASGDTLAIGRSALRLDLGEDRVAVAVSPREQFGLLVGRSVAERAVFAVLESASASDATVLLEGETGTGKEAAAESIHLASGRRDGPLVVVDCGAIPHDLLEAELFGHERGAYSGAAEARAGAFESAQGGTIFLDEIGELPADVQPKLLRALDRREVKRIGQVRYTPVDVRVVAATNRNLRAEVNARRFRADLYYRLAVVQVTLPPLRERPEDLPLLVEHILGALGAAAHPRAARLRTPEFLAELARHAWPGNVRELRNYVERCLALDETVAAVPAAATGARVDAARPLREQRKAWLDALERAYLEEILARHGGNVTAAARAAGVDRIHFYRLLWRYGLK